jgi:hypothetical protein
VASHPLSPTKFKSLLNEQAFLHLADEDENLRGQRFDPSVAGNVALATARRASHAVASYPLSPTKFKSLLNEQAFLHHMSENLRGLIIV